MVKNKVSKDSNDKNANWQPLRELALNTPYAMGYLSLMARRKQLKVKKVGRVWHSTMEHIKEFEEKMQERKELRKKQLQESYREKVKREVLKEIEEKNDEVLKQVQDDTERIEKEGFESEVKKHKLSTEDTIFDEVQKELEEVLEEIRNREKRLRQEYLAYRGIHGGDGAETYGNAALAREKRETEEISENLIMDLGKLLNTANKIHEEESSGESADNIDNSTYEGVSIPVKNQNLARGHVRHGGIHTMGMDLPARTGNAKKHADKTGNIGHKDNFLSVPYSTFPFERHSGSEYNPYPPAYGQAQYHSLPVRQAGGTGQAGRTGRQSAMDSQGSQSSQNKLLLFIAGLLVFVASVLLILVMFG